MSKVGRAQRRSSVGVAGLAASPPPRRSARSTASRRRAWRPFPSVRDRSAAPRHRRSRECVTRPCWSISPARICAKALAGLVTEPPNEPECRSRFGPVTCKLVIGDAPQAVSDGRHAGGKLAAVANHDAIAGQPVGVLGEVVLQTPWLPTSSSPSMRNFRFSGRRPSTVIHASALFRWVSTWPLSSVAPRA